MTFALVAFDLPALRGHGTLVRLGKEQRVARMPGAPETTLKIWRAGESGEGRVIDVREATDVIAIEPVTDSHSWRIESSGVTCAWPHGTTLGSDPWERAPFVLALSAEGAVSGEVAPSAEQEIWVQTLARSEVEPIERFAVEGMRIRTIAESADGALRIDLDYPLDDALWWQRKYVLPWSDELAMIVSAQARATHEETVALAAELVASTIQPIER